ncbi:MAG TPA: NAD(P)-binding domain-containing protein, partial [Trebonia sp.]
MAAKRPRAGYQTFDVLVLDAGYKQTLASARSLGRAGLRVALGESVAEYRPPVPLPAFASRYCAHRLVLPNYADDARGFADAVLDFVGKHRVQVVLPTGDAASAALVPFRGELAKLGCTLALAPDAALEIANDKARTLEIALELGIPVPRSLPVGGIDDLPSVAAGLGFPFVLKPTISWTGKAAKRVVPIEVVTMAEAIAATERFLAAEAGVLAQRWASGRREGVTLFIQDGNVVASYGHVEHRTTPALGGASVVRESIQAPRDVLDAAVRLAKAVGMQGVCAVEFRRDADNRPLLMEINPRLVSTTGNAIQSGIDLPLMIWQWATGIEVKPVASHRAGVRTRWLRGDIRWLMENQGRVGRPDSEPRLRSFWIFASEFVRTWRYDYLDVRDFRPAIAELRSIAATTRRVVRNKSASLSTARREQVVKTVNALVIGAGPFGLSISAHLRGRGVDHMIVGRPVDTWRSHMPLGMNLKSEPYGSVISAPSTGFDIATYCASKGFEYVHRAGPLALERFLGYADWFTEQLVPDVREETVTEVAQADGGFRVAFAEAEPVSARQVVIATGVLPYARVPAEFTGLPKDLVTHTADHHLLDKFAGRRVAVIGSGQSALETAALAHEQGADVV